MKKEKTERNELRKGGAGHPTPNWVCRPNQSRLMTSIGDWVVGEGSPRTPQFGDHSGRIPQDWVVEGVPAGHRSPNLGDIPQIEGFRGRPRQLLTPQSGSPTDSDKASDPSARAGGGGVDGQQGHPKAHPPQIWGMRKAKFVGM
ncbi:hypothetical protein CRG98_026976 [Punica granatum]|uniref:Uncharacterized protein n=1 Tax=Punica granatum TaxID=22663 RepID=A0A2I0JAE9_PUNGR|nr:hypothetical protein CRG98_026976 [Punica granatum]